MKIIEYLIGQLKEEYDTLLFKIIFVHKGILLPQIITHWDIIRAFRTPIRFLHVTFPYIPYQEWGHEVA
jgi:hypothetical protein